MDSTPNPTQPQPKPLSIKACARKLPIKRKTPDSSSNPNPNPNVLFPKIETTDGEGEGDGDGDGDGEGEGDEEIGGDRKAPPFKFHRIWTETDEIRFLQGLQDCSTESLAFPRDLHVFYARFSETMSQPYTKSQLSEKLRRLRKKFRVISSRLARGLDASLLSPHDRSLFHLSKQLWHPQFSLNSPFNSNSNNNTTKKKETLVGVKVSFSPTLPSTSVLRQTTHGFNEHSVFNYVDDHDDEDDGNDGDVKMTDVNIESNIGVLEQDLSLPSSFQGGLGGVVAKTAIDVFDQSLKEVRTVLIRKGLLCPDHRSASGGGSLKQGDVADFERRWQEQRVAELDVLGRRLRLVLEHALHGQ